jgi:hypothetical protein
MPFFTIESAVSRAGDDCQGAGSREFRTLEIEGPSDGRRRHRACLIFSAAVDAARTTPVGYVAEDADGAVSLVGWLPAEDFALYRDAVASGEAARVLYETRDETSGYLRRIALTRAAGPVIAAGGCRRLRAQGEIRTAFAMPL